MRFSGSVIDFKSSENDFSAKKFDGKTWVEFKKIDNKPSTIKIYSTYDMGDICISIQHLDHIEPVTTGNCTIDLSNYEDGEYIITATAKNAENISVRYEFI